MNSHLSRLLAFFYKAHKKGSTLRILTMEKLTYYSLVRPKVRRKGRLESNYYDKNTQSCNGNILGNRKPTLCKTYYCRNPIHWNEELRKRITSKRTKGKANLSEVPSNHNNYSSDVTIALHWTFLSIEELNSCVPILDFTHFSMILAMLWILLWMHHNYNGIKTIDNYTCDSTWGMFYGFNAICNGKVVSYAEIHLLKNWKSFVAISIGGFHSPQSFGGSHYFVTFGWSFGFCHWKRNVIYL